MRLKPTVISHLLVCSLVLSSLGITGCHSNPLKSLKSDQEDSRLTDEFWKNEQTHNTVLWQEAVNYCGTHLGHNNCELVIERNAHAVDEAENKRDIAFIKAHPFKWPS
jgi:hypothetical protein